EADFVHAGNGPQLAISIDFARVVLQQDHLQYDVYRRLARELLLEKRKDVRASFFKRRSGAIPFIGFLRSAIEREDHVIQAAVEKQIGALVVHQRGIRRHSRADAGVARDADHLEDTRMNHWLADSVRPDEFDVVFAVLNDLAIQIEIHVLV